MWNKYSSISATGSITRDDEVGVFWKTTTKFGLNVPFCNESRDESELDSNGINECEIARRGVGGVSHYLRFR